MSLPRYAEYKDSGIAWLGELPAHWDVWPLKRGLRLLTEKTDQRTFPIALENIESWTGRFLATDSTFEGDGVAFDSGDILFGKLRPYLAKALLVSASGQAVGDFHVLRPKSNMYGRFYQYHLLNRDFISIVDGSTFGARMPRASWDFMAQILLTVPTRPEQVAIATFLDRETAKIDALIAEQERLIALLAEKRQAVISHAVTKGLNPAAPMKDSGIDWLGEVPAHWEVKRLKFLARVQSGVAKGRDLGDMETVVVPFLRVANVQDGYLDLEDVTTIEIGRHEVDRYLLQPGDVLMNEGGDFDKLGRGHVWRGEIEKCIHQNHVFAVRPNKIEPEWLNLLTISESGRFYFMSRSKQSTNLASISSTNIYEFPVICPPVVERQAIVRHVQVERAKLDTLTAEAQRAIDLLKEHRAALISAAVTGKIDVRGLVAAA